MVFLSSSKLKENLTELHIIVRTTGLCFLFVRMNCILDQQLHGIMILLMKQAETMVLPENGVIRCQFCIWDLQKMEFRGVDCRMSSVMYVIKCFTFHFICSYSAKILSQ